MYQFLAFFVALLIGYAFSHAAEPTAKKSDLPLLDPTDPSDALETFTIKKGFTIELAAAEPLVVDPVAMAFDENGKLYVIEMVGYSEHREDKLGRVRLLEDLDGNGRFDKSTVFARELSWPTAVTCYDGGIFVGVTPDIIYLKDTDGDNKADERRIIFTGFGDGEKRLNMQALMNSFRWGLDNRIHGSASGTRGKVRVPSRPELGEISFVRSDFSFNPRTYEFRLETGGAQHGMDFDAMGRKFVCSNSRHIQQVMYDRRYIGDNPNFIPSPPLIDIAIDGGAAPVFRKSPDEPWRVIRTRWRVAGQVKGPVEGGGRPSGYFTAATGITIYDGDVWDSEFKGDAFIADCGSNLVHRKKLYPDGPKMTAIRPEDERKTEFLASTDNWFRPVQMEVGPDGALYIADMYREVIEHPWSLPQGIKQHIDLDSGNDRGRIYRIVPQKFTQPKMPRLAEASDADLVKMLDHPNGWHRSTATRLLFERKNHQTIEPLRLIVNHGKNAYGRMHALHVLAGTEALAFADILIAYRDASPIVRKEAIRLTEHFLSKKKLTVDAGENFETDLSKSLLGMANDPDNIVRYQLSWTLGKLEVYDKPKIISKLFEKAGDDPWQLTALLNAATVNHEAILKELKMNPVFNGLSISEPVLKNLKAMQAGRVANFSASSSKGSYRGQLFKPSQKADPDRAKIIKKYQSSLGIRGNAQRGREIFEQRCVSCHRLGGVGLNIGPDLKSIRANGPEKLLVSLIDPNREVAPEYLMQKVYSARQDETILGTIKFMSDVGILMRLPDGSDHQLVRSSGDKIESTGLSFMPTGLESGLSLVQMADLLEWVLKAD